MTITLSESSYKLAQTKAQAAGFPDVTAFVEDLIQGDELDHIDWEAITPERCRVRNRAELEAKIKEGMESGEPIEMTMEMLKQRQEEIRRRVEAQPNARS